MKTWLKALLAVVLVLLLAGGAWAAFATYHNGNDVYATLAVGQGPGGMYLRCVSVTGTGASCTPSNQTTLTVHQRDRVHLTIRNDDRGSHTHDFNVLGWQYFLPPASPEMELEETTESWTFTAWASGTYRMICELEGHDADGMHGTLVVLGS
jgi:hypothetical protein